MSSDKKLPGKGMVAAGSLLMLVWGIINAGYFAGIRYVMEDEEGRISVTALVIVLIVSAFAIVRGILGIAGAGKVSKASAVVVGGAVMFVLSIVGGIVSIAGGGAVVVSVALMLAGLVISCTVIAGGAKNRA